MSNENVIELVADISATRKRGAQKWAYKRTLNGADYDTDGVRQISITAGGSGYETAPAVTIAAPTDGVQATAIAVLTAGVVSNIIITNPGSGYTTDPSISLAAPPQGGSQATASLSRVDVWHDGTLRKASEINFDQPDETDELEDGTETFPEEGKITADLNLTLGQDDAKTIRFLMRESRKYQLSLMFEKGKSTGGTTQQIFVPITKLARRYASKSGDRKPIANFKMVKNLTAVVPSNVPTWAKGVAADYTVPAEEFFEVYEG